MNPPPPPPLASPVACSSVHMLSVATAVCFIGTDGHSVPWKVYHKVVHSNPFTRSTLANEEGVVICSICALRPKKLCVTHIVPGIKPNRWLETSREVGKTIKSFDDSSPSSYRPPCLDSRSLNAALRAFEALRRSGLRTSPCFRSPALHGTCTTQAGRIEAAGVRLR